MTFRPLSAFFAGLRDGTIKCSPPPPPPSARARRAALAARLGPATEAAEAAAVNTEVFADAPLPEVLWPAASPPSPRARRGVVEARSTSTITAAVEAAHTAADARAWSSSPALFPDSPLPRPAASPSSLVEEAEWSRRIKRTAAAVVLFDELPSMLSQALPPQMPVLLLPPKEGTVPSRHLLGDSIRCKICQRPFTTKWQRDRHAATHEAEREMFRCVANVMIPTALLSCFFSFLHVVRCYGLPQYLFFSCCFLLGVFF